MKSKRFIAVFIIILIISPFTNLFSQEKLGKYNTSWSNVIPGKVITDPIITSYGFCVVTDGRMLSAFSNDGKLLWEKPTYSSKYVQISCINEDFIILWDKRKSSLKLFNPSGTLLWDKTLDYEVSNMPLMGRDGRFFITGENVIECYSINGICKWSYKTDTQKGLPLKELPDGSVLVFLTETEGKTNAIRLSPFGQYLESITFAGTVIKAYTLPEGVFLTFDDGSSGLFSLVNGLSENKWVLGVKPSNSYLIADNKNTLFLELYNDRIVVDKINVADGNITNQFTVKNINGLDLQLAKLNNSGLFLADSTICYIINMDGSINYTAYMLEDKGSTRWNYVIYTRDNHIVYCLENWTLNAYLTSQVRYNTNVKINGTYKEYYNIDTSPYSYNFTETINRNIASLERFNTLKEGYYGEDEIIYASDIYSFCVAYLESVSRQFSSKNVSIFDKDAYGTECMLKQLPLLCTNESASYLAKLIGMTKNKSNLNIIINSCIQCGYDPDGKILKEIEIALSKINHKDILLMQNICDAVYSICYFMGRPAFNLRGKNIITTFFNPQFDASIREYAKNTLIKITALENNKFTE